MSEPQPPAAPRKAPAGRPGAMTMAMRAVQPATSGPKVLRIGLIQAGKIVEERIIRRRETVSVGTSEKNHFIVQAPGLPSRFDAFQLVGNDYILNFTESMKGRVALPGGVQDLEKLRTSGGARNAGSHFQVKLSDTSRGKVVIGDTTLLFQFVVPPPVQPRPQLPAAARGGLVAGIDWLFTAICVFTYMMLFGFIVYLESSDWPIQQGIAEIPEAYRFIYEAAPEPPPEENTVEETPTDEGTEEPEKVTKAPPRTTKAPQQTTNTASTEQPQGESSAEQTARIRESARANAEALLLGALGEGGALNDVLAGGAVTSNAADVLAQAQGVDVATSRGGTIRERSGGGGSGQGGDLTSLRRAGGAGATRNQNEGGAVQERQVRGRFSMGSGGDIGGAGDMDGAAVARMIRGRSSAFRRCYETSLRSNPSLAGRVSVQFTIQERGNVSGARATENTTGDSALASCVTRVVSGLRWRQGPEGGAVTFSYPFIFAPQN